MFNRSKEEVALMESKVNSYINQAFDECQKILAERGKGYNTTVSVVDYFPHGEQDIIYEVFKKITRAENAMKAIEGGKAIDKDRVEDNVLDAINYLAIMYAMLQLKEESKTTKFTKDCNACGAYVDPDTRICKACKEEQNGSMLNSSNTITV